MQSPQRSTHTMKVLAPPQSKHTHTHNLKSSNYLLAVNRGLRGQSGLLNDSMGIKLSKVQSVGNHPTSSAKGKGKVQEKIKRSRNLKKK